jgi:ABC-type nitrate/sulfonate/bicarbonate transport system substrate-binding protein
MMLRQHGLARGQVTPVYLLPAEQLAALKEGRIDAAIAREPWVQRMIHGADAKLIITEGDLGIYTNVEGYAVERSWLRANRQTAVRFVQALLLASHIVSKDPAIAVRGWAADFGIKEAWAEAIFHNVPPPLIHEWTNPRYNYGLVKDSPLHRSLGYIAAFLYEQRLIPNPVETHNVMDASIVAEALRTHRGGR